MQRLDILFVYKLLCKLNCLFSPLFYIYAYGRQCGVIFGSFSDIIITCYDKVVWNLKAMLDAYSTKPSCHIVIGAYYRLRNMLRI